MADTTTHLDIDLRFSLDEPDDAGSAPLTGSVHADGLDIEVFLSNPERFLHHHLTSLAAVRTVAAGFAEHSLVVSLFGPDGLIARIGAVQAPVAQRMVTRSPHLMLGNAAAVTALLRRWRQGPQERLVTLPPSTPFPLVPTVSRRIKRRVTTTHYTPGAGRARLIFVVGSENWDGRPPREFDLLPGITRIGSAPYADLQLEGLDDLHAEIRHDDNDEYVLHARGVVGGGSSTASPEQGLILRTGARIEMGPWRMGYFREEYADHGRPYGGRLGGELSVQKPQPGRRSRRG
ncbi:FHA domain-containing protein [Cryobacterium sp. 1639]|uniref:FHA domain-containing protein n=1 Tax=Cryobacterium inferilacus TaxID=2866629 RepID=UPI001C73B61E|nr:FHA domain-containing protein [Cryobacterium sp. 1639]MBX0299731.1 FHA domain-containing protein [Cryobacterium sp. 1639]